MVVIPLGMLMEATLLHLLNKRVGKEVHLLGMSKVTNPSQASKAASPTVVTLPGRKSRDVRDLQS